MNLMRSILAEDSSFWLPQSASTVAPNVDWIFNFVLWVSVFFFVLIMTLMVIFVFKYHHTKGRKHESTAGHSTGLELTWTIIPTIICIMIFYYGFRNYLAMAVEPPNAYEITVIAKMWNWGFQYPNGYVSPELHLPANTPVRFVLTSDDVIHSLYIPAFRVKKDVVPGRYNRMWVQATEVGEFEIECAEYCGTNHSRMLSKCVVHDPEDFKAWLEKASNWEGRISPIQRGEEIYSTRGCSQCHSLNGATGIGPTWRNMFGNNIPLTNGQTIVANEEYVRESILYPQAKVHAGFGPNSAMPPYLGSIKDKDINAVIAFMKSISTNFKGDLTPLKQVAPTAPAPAK